MGGGGGGSEGQCRAQQWVGPWLLVGGRNLGMVAVRATLVSGTGANSVMRGALVLSLACLLAWQCVGAQTEDGTIPTHSRGVA